MDRADRRVHGTTHEVPLTRFERDERDALRPLPLRMWPVRERSVERRVANDAFIDVDTIRYSVPHRLVRDRVSVHLADTVVRIFHGQELVATHTRSFEPHSVVRDPAHFDGLWRSVDATTTTDAEQLAHLGRSLDDYAAVIDSRGAA